MTSQQNILTLERRLGVWGLHEFCNINLGK